MTRNRDFRQNPLDSFEILTEMSENVRFSDISGQNCHRYRGLRGPICQKMTKIGRENWLQFGHFLDPLGGVFAGLGGVIFEGLPWTPTVQNGQKRVPIDL